MVGSKFIIALVASCALAVEPNPPNWDPTRVMVFQPGDGTAQARINAVFAENGGHSPAWHGQWSTSRYALLFAPGDHTNLNVEVGYYTTVHGLGRKPTDTVIGNLMSQNGDFNYEGGALANFWRGAENVRNTNNPMLWAVSQAAPIRRIHTDGDLQLFQYNSGCCAGYASGGFASDIFAGGAVTTGSQQQFFVRNADINRAEGGVWNMVWMGSPNAPGWHCTNSGGLPITNINSTPVIAEKPYFVMDGTQYKIMKPKLEYYKSGHTNNWEYADEIDFSQVYVASDQDSAATINAKLNEGLHLVLQPGNYNLEESIKINNPNTVVLGMGLATLISVNGNACIEVANVDGVRIGGILLQAGFAKSDSLLTVGQPGYAGNAANPVGLYDIYARVGGMNPTGSVQTDRMVTVNTGNTIIDNVWLWRADHDVNGSVYDSRNYVATGLQVNGDNVYGYGLAVEHTLGNMLEWFGNNGHTYFFQSEYPYDVTQQNYGDPGYVAYKVGANVQKHDAYGVGAYTFFRDYDVTVNTGISCPDRLGVAFHNSLNVFLNGYGRCNHVINQMGNAASAGSGQVNYVCEYGSVIGVEEFLQ